MSDRVLNDCASNISYLQVRNIRIVYSSTVRI